MMVECPLGNSDTRSVSPSSTISHCLEPGVSDDYKTDIDSSSCQMQLDSGPFCGSQHGHFHEGSFSKQMAELRLKKDLRELKCNRVTCDFAKNKVIFPRDHSLLHLRLIVSPVRGPYKGGNFEFKVDIPPMYPFYAPKVTCLTKVYHPNICMHTGRVYIAILGKDWRPVLTVNAVLLGLQLIFLEPNPEFPVNPECCEVYKHDPTLFQRLVRQSVKFSDGEKISSQRAPSPSSMMMVNDDNGPFAAPSGPSSTPVPNAVKSAFVAHNCKRRASHADMIQPYPHSPRSAVGLQNQSVPARKRMRRSSNPLQQQRQQTSVDAVGMSVSTRLSRRYMGTHGFAAASREALAHSPRALPRW